MKTLPTFFIVLEKGSMIWNSLVPKERTHISNKLLLFIAGVREGRSFRGEQGDSILIPDEGGSEVQEIGTLPGK